MENKYRKEFRWVISVLESCTHEGQLKSVSNLFENLVLKHYDNINCKGNDCLMESLIREEFNHYYEIKSKSLIF
jgi:hypothetical protein